MALHLLVNPDAPEDRALVLAAEVLKAGGVVVYPTETLYGLGANAWNPDAVRKVRGIKQREGQKPILVIVHSEEAVLGLTDEIPEAGRLLMRAFWPGPLTLVFAAGQHAPPDLSPETGTIGIRISSSPLCLKLAALCGYPIVSTSANISGQQTPRTAEMIETVLGSGVDLFLDAGILPKGPPSTVVDVTGPHPRILREGAVSHARLAAIVPDIIP